MAKKPSSLPNRLARCRTRRGHVIAAVLKPADERRSLFEVAWDVLVAGSDLEVKDVAELEERMTREPAFSAAEAAGWVVGTLGAALAYPRATDPLADPKLVAIEADLIVALGPDAVWHPNGDHPLAQYRSNKYGGGRGWNSITQATFDAVLLARGNGLDLVIAQVDED